MADIIAVNPFYWLGESYAQPQAYLLLILRLSRIPSLPFLGKLGAFLVSCSSFLVGIREATGETEPKANPESHLNLTPLNLRKCGPFSETKQLQECLSLF